MRIFWVLFISGFFLTSSSHAQWAAEIKITPPAVSKIVDIQEIKKGGAKRQSKTAGVPPVMLLKSPYQKIQEVPPEYYEIVRKLQKPEEASSLQSLGDKSGKKADSQPPTALQLDKKDKKKKSQTHGEVIAAPTAPPTVTSTLEPYPVVHFFGKAPRKDWKVADPHGLPLTINEKQELEGWAAVLGEKTEKTFVAVGPTGETENWKFDIYFPSYKEWKDPVLRKVKKPFPLGITATLGYTQGVFQQTFKDVFQQGSVTLKLGYNYRFGLSRFEVGGNFFSTLFSFYDSSTTANLYTLGFNIRGGVRLTPLLYRVNVTLQAGWYYLTMFVSDQSFGFQNLSGPQLYPVVRFKVHPRHSLAAYFKFSPLWSGAGFLALNNRDISVGLSHAMAVGKGLSVVTSIDYSNLTFEWSSVASRFDSLSISGGVLF